MKYLIILFASLVVFVTGFFLIRPQLHSPKGKIAVAMTGRSTMELWFKHWNWPYPLRIKTTYRKWPIKYDKFSHGDMYFEYHELPGPISKDRKKPFGQDMLNAFKHILTLNNYDISFFKFCFVDFRVSEKNNKKRFVQLINTVQSAAKIAKENRVKLIVGNALPMPNSNETTIELQLEFNEWLKVWAKEKKNVVVFDLFGPLVENDGRLKKNLSRGDGDPHLGDKAFSILDGNLFQIISK